MEESEKSDYVAKLQEVLAVEKLFLLGIIIAGLGALWTGFSRRDTITFAALLLLSLALVYLRFPRSWSMIFWLAGIYIMTVIGGLLIFAWSPFSTALTILGIGSLLLGAYLGFLFVEHVKDFRDSMGEGEHVTMGLWSLAVLLFVFISLLSSYGVYVWFRTGSFVIYVLSEVFLVLSLPYVLLKTEDVGATIFKAEGIIHFGDEKCNACDALLSLEIKKCPSCETSRIFKWCPVCEGYMVTCPECRERTLWRETCGLCNADLSRDAVCRDCKESNLMHDWRD